MPVLLGLRLRLQWLAPVVPFSSNAAIFPTRSSMHRQAIDNTKSFPTRWRVPRVLPQPRPWPIGIVAAPFVIAMVSSPGEKFINQIALIPSPLRRRSSLPAPAKSAMREVD